LASLTLVACDEATDPTVTGPGNSLPSAEAPIPITACGTVITQPGVYVMAADFGMFGAYCPGPVIVIRVSNVTIRGDRHGVDANGGPCILAGVGVPGGVSHIRLIGVDLRACNGDAIVFENVSASVVEGSTIRSNIGSGIAITGSPALSQADTVRNSNFSFNQRGVTVTAGSDFIITDNFWDGGSTLSGENCGVILVGDVSHSTIRRNTFQGECTSIAVGGHRNSVISNVVDLTFGNVAIAVGGQKNVIGENRVRNGGGFEGIQDGGHYNTLRGNTVERGNIGIGAEGRFGVIRGNTVQNTVDGIAVSGDGNRVNGNTALNNDEAGIHVRNRGNVIAENTALNNAVFDLQDDLPCGANTWRRNTFGTASAPCIQ
jgi:parallel beta-helix repeat protein